MNSLGTGKALGCLVEIKKGRQCREAIYGRPYLQIDQLRGHPVRLLTQDSGTEVCPSDLIIVWDGAYSGLVGNGLTGVIGSTLARMRCITKDIYPPYLAAFLKMRFQSIQAARTGATIPHVGRAHLEQMLIPLPPLPEQKRIAAILDKADTIRRKREQAIALTDSFLRSVFLEMFGDPVTNPKGWPIRRFEELGELNRGKSKHRPRNAPQLLGGPYPLIQTGEIANSGGYIRTFESTYSEIGLRQSKLWPKDTLCITIAANIAKTGILTFEACFPDSVVGFHPNEQTTTEYIQHWLSFLQKILEDKAPESAQKNINLEILRKLEVPTPPMELQSTFSAFVHKNEQAKERQRNARGIGQRMSAALSSELLSRDYAADQSRGLSGSAEEAHALQP